MRRFFQKNPEMKNMNHPIKVVDVTISALKSHEGKYFISQSEELTLGGGTHAWAGLFNPANSGVNLYFDYFSVSSLSQQVSVAEVWFNPSFLPGQRKTSTLVSPADLSIKPPPVPKVIHQYASNVLGFPTGGVNPYGRVVGGDTTIVSDASRGAIVIPPGESFVMFVKTTAVNKIKIRIVLSWWEEV